MVAVSGFAEGYPIDGSELARRLLNDPRRVQRDQDREFVDAVRAQLAAFGCPRSSSSERARYLVDEEMEARVREAMEEVRGGSIG